MIPAILVPVYLIAHLAVFMHLTGATAARSWKDGELFVGTHAM
jgi:hypothetical protein